jgi:hypothetical protein
MSWWRAILPFRDFARLFDVVPYFLLGEIEQHRQNDQKDENLHSNPLACVLVRLCRPH